MRILIALAILSASTASASAETALILRSKPALPQSSLVRVQTTNSCGAPPALPVDCQTTTCVCDTNGQNCQWTIACR